MAGATQIAWLIWATAPRTREVILMDCNLISFGWATSFGSICLRCQLNVKCSVWKKVLFIAVKLVKKYRPPVAGLGEGPGGGRAGTPGPLILGEKRRNGWRKKTRLGKKYRSPLPSSSMSGSATGFLSSILLLSVRRGGVIVSAFNS